jgi:hypothetical protein
VQDYEDLLILSGLYSEFNTTQSDVTFKGHWYVIRNWDEGARYLTGRSSKDVGSFLTSIREIVKWIKKYL